MKRALTLLVLLAAAVLPLAPSPAIAAPATPAAGRYYCGSLCNDKPPSYVIKKNGVQCRHSAKVVATGHPKGFKDVAGATGPGDPGIAIKVYYSTVCQTLWASITNTRNTGRVLCQTSSFYTLPGGGSPDGGYTARCPALGKTVTVNMANDHSPTYGKAAAIYVLTCLSGHRCSNYNFTY